MSDVQNGPDWWRASDGKWYPPDQHTAMIPLAPPSDRPRHSRRTIVTACTVAVVLLVVALVVLTRGGSKDNTVVSGAASTSEPTTSPTRPTTSTTTQPTTTVPTVAYPGRLLLTQRDYSNNDGLLQLTAVSPDPTAVVDLPPIAGTFEAVSADGRRVAYEGPDHTLTVIGADFDQNVPDAVEVSSPVFSPDDQQLAYIMGVGTVVVFDLGTRSAHTILQTPCATYYDVGQLCGDASAVVWIDPTTLLVSHFTGEMPDVITGGGVPPANTVSIVTTNGAIVNSVSAASPEGSVHGNTVLLSDGTWLDIAQLRDGTASATPLPRGTEMESLSPDGTHVVVQGDPWWQLVDLRSGEVQQLGTRAFPNPAGQTSNDSFAWSPDGQWFAVQNSLQYSVNIVVVPISSVPGAIVGTLDRNQTNMAYVMGLIAWTA